MCAQTHEKHAVQLAALGRARTSVPARTDFMRQTVQQLQGTATPGALSRLLEKLQLFSELLLEPAFPSREKHLCGETPPNARA